MLIRTFTALSLSFALFASSPSLAHTVTPEALAAAKAEIERLKQDLQVKQAELQAMELQMARQKAAPAPTSKPASKPMVEVKPVAPTPVAAAGLQRAMVDPAPYEASIKGRIAIFRTTQPSKWLVLDEKRVVFWVLDDEAYLLNLALACPGLLSAKKLKLENFSTKVRAGMDSVIFDDQQCLIESIALLGGRSLPKPPRK